MKDYKIHINDDLDIAFKKVLNDYWHVQNGIFLYKSKEIIKIHGISQGELTKLVKNYSYCEINHGTCWECKEEMKEKVAAQTVYMSSMRNKINTCSKCKIEIRRKAEKEYQDRLEEIRNKKLAYFNKALNEKKWIELPKNELIILCKLIENKTKSRIYANVFEGDYHNRSIWGFVNKFEGMGFLNVIRNGNSVKEFEFDERINEAVRNFILTKNYANKGREASTLDYLSFSLTKKENKLTIKHPDYGGKFRLQKDVVLRANEEYIYSGWIQIDGSINLKFTPLSNLQSNIVTQENIGNQPELVGEIIKNMFNEIRNDTRNLPTFDQVFGTLDSNSYEDDN